MFSFALIETLHQGWDPLSPGIKVSPKRSQEAVLNQTPLPSQQWTGVAYRQTVFVEQQEQQQKNISKVVHEIKYTEVKFQQYIKGQSVAGKEEKYFLTWPAVSLSLSFTLSYSHMLTESLRPRWLNLAIWLTRLIRARRIGRRVSSSVFLICTLLIWDESEVLLK